MDPPRSELTGYRRPFGHNVILRYAKLSHPIPYSWECESSKSSAGTQDWSCKSVTTRDALLLAHGEAANALEMPAVRFLGRRKQAPFVIAVFRTAFGPEVSQIHTPVLHLLVE